MIPRNSNEWNRVLTGGVVAGLIGGIALGVLLVVLSLAGGRDVWLSLKGAGIPFLHARAMQPGFDAVAVLVGLIAHLAVSVAWAIPFALLADGMTRGATVAFGVLWGIVVWLGMYYVVLPIFGLARMAKGTPVPMAVLMHVFFGIIVAVGYLPFQHTRRTGRIIEAH